MPNRENAYCYMRAVSAVAIVLLHTFQYAFSSFEVMGREKIMSVAVRNDMLWAVPVFVMVTGALMLAKEREFTYAKLFGSYLKKIIILLLVCTVASRALDQYFLLTEEAEGIGLFLKNSVKALLTAQGWSEFWYLYLLIAIYISLPALRAMVRGMDALDLKYILGVLFIFQSLLPFVFRLGGMEFGWYILFFSIYPFYLIAGYYIKVYGKIFGKPLWGIAVCMAVQTVLTVECFLHGLSALIQEIGLYSFPVNVLTAVFIFCFCIGWGNRKQGWIERLLLRVDPYTLDIYLIHLFLIHILVYGVKFNPYRYGIWMVFAEAAGIFLSSLIVAWVLRNILGMLKGVRGT